MIQQLSLSWCLACAAKGKRCRTCYRATDAYRAARVVWTATYLEKRKTDRRARIASLLTGARRRAKERDVECSIVAEDLMPYPDVCPILGIALSYSGNGGAKGGTNNSASVDRIDPNIGYVPGNVRIVSFRANMLKSNATVDELRSVLRDIMNLSVDRSAA